MKNKFELFNKLYIDYITYNMRKGQATFNAVHTIDSEIANELRGTELDCFYDDSKIGVFMKYLHSKWDD